MNLSDRTALINRIASMSGPVTLDGKPALICNLASDFLQVVTMSLPRVRAEFSWEAVQRVLDAGGAFKS